jgi:hypothetical protein
MKISHQNCRLQTMNNTEIYDMKNSFEILSGAALPAEIP